MKRRDLLKTASAAGLGALAVDPSVCQARTATAQDTARVDVLVIGGGTAGAIVPAPGQADSQPND